jgi:hypothetical protein
MLFLEPIAEYTVRYMAPTLAQLKRGPNMGTGPNISTSLLMCSVHLRKHHHYTNLPRHVYNSFTVYLPAYRPTFLPTVQPHHSASCGIPTDRVSDTLLGLHCEARKLPQVIIYTRWAAIRWTNNLKCSGAWRSTKLIVNRRITAASSWRVNHTARTHHRSDGLYPLCFRAAVKGAAAQSTEHQSQFDFATRPSLR